MCESETGANPPRSRLDVRSTQTSHQERFKLPDILWQRRRLAEPREQIHAVLQRCPVHRLGNELPQVRHCRLHDLLVRQVVRHADAAPTAGNEMAFGSSLTLFFCLGTGTTPTV